MKLRLHLWLLALAGRWGGCMRRFFTVASVAIHLSLQHQQSANLCQRQGLCVGGKQAGGWRLFLSTTREARTRAPSPPIHRLLDAVAAIANSVPPVSHGNKH